MNSDDDPQIRKMLEQLRAHKATGQGVENCMLSVRGLLDGVGAGERAYDALERAGVILRKEYMADEILHRHTCAERHERWYHGPADDSRIWPALKARLRGMGRNEDALRELDESSNEIVSLLGDPASRTPFRRRGLVVGYVQSGKTASMTAVIAKAVDAGYNMVIVLAGLTEKLRQQTQGRLEQDLFGDRPGEWRQHTSREAGDDFERPRDGGGRFVVHERTTHLLVLKKTTLRSRRVEGEFAGPLGKLEATLRDTPAGELRRFRVLILDDECDQATVNSASGDMDVSVINDCIRRVLEHIPFVTYVGYTATPFANVLINPWPNDRSRHGDRQLDDLYPSSFITVLPRPDAYFGPEQLFGSLGPGPVDDGTPESNGLPFLCDVLDEDEKMLQPPGRDERESFQPSMPSSLQDAILYFLACCAARVARGDGEEHMTMLLHTSVYKDMHERTATLMEDWTGQQRPMLADRTSAVSQRLIALFRDEQGKTAGLFPQLKPVAPESLHDHLPAILRELRFPVENGSSDDRLDFADKARRYIVTGGSILARGLTLEGLMVSYFLRSTTQFDTLLQMGRWFGYRTGHEDLPRIWTTPELQDRFSQLADVEAHIREDIARYRDRDMTPMDLAVRIPLIPGMAITGATKMKHAQPARLSYHGQEEQTTRFRHRDPETVETNWQAGAALLERLESLDDCRDIRATSLLWRNAPLPTVRRFLREYRPHEVQKSLDPAMLESFLDRLESHDRLLSWSVAVVEGRDQEGGGSALLGPETVRLGRRSKMTGGSPDSAWLKAILSARDCLRDIAPERLPRPLPASWDGIRELRRKLMPGVPLLLLFPIDRSSPVTPGKGGKISADRGPLDAIDHLLGYAIVFPESPEPERDLVEVDIRPPPEEDADVMAGEEMMASAAAGDTGAS